MKGQIGLRFNTDTLLSPVAMIKLAVTLQILQVSKHSFCLIFNDFTMIVHHLDEVLNKLATVGFSQ